MDHNPTNDHLIQHNTTVATATPSPKLSRRTLLKAGAVAGGTLAISGCTITGEAQPDDAEPKPTEGVDDLRVPRLHLDTLEAEVEGETLQAVSYEDWQPNSTTYVGQVSGIRGPDLFVGISRLGDDAEQFESEEDAELVVYLCNGEVGAVPTIRVYQTVDYDSSGVTLTEENVSSTDGQIEIKLASVEGTFLGSLALADGEPFPFIAHEATGDAGLYKAETEDGDLLARWVVFPDGRQRGGMSMDGKGNDVYVGGSLRKFCVFNYCIYY